MILKRSNIVTISIDHRGNVAGGFNNQSVDWQLRQQRRMQDNHTRQVQESFSSNPISLIRRTNPGHVYWKELEETLPQKVKLTKDLQLLLKPVNQYYSWNHKSYIYGTYKCLDNPLNIIRNAYSMKVDTYQYQKNRSYYSNLYKSMREADISHSDILSIWGNPYIGTVTKWNELSWQRKQNLKLQYPEMEKLAEDIAEQKRNFYDILRNNICSPAQRFLDEYGFAISALASTNAYTRVGVGAYNVVRGAVAVAPKMVKLITTLGSVELARQFQILYKKNSGDGLKKRTESNAPRIQNTPQEVMDYIKGLTDKKGYILNRGKTKDGYHYYEVIKKFEYKGRKFFKGEYISRDTKHHEIEHFRDKDYHYGALDPVKGNLKPGSQVPERRLHLK